MRYGISTTNVMLKGESSISPPGFHQESATPRTRNDHFAILRDIEFHIFTVMAGRWTVLIWIGRLSHVKHTGGALEGIAHAFTTSRHYCLKSDRSLTRRSLTGQWRSRLRSRVPEEQGDWASADCFSPKIHSEPEKNVAVYFWL